MLLSEALAASDKVEGWLTQKEQKLLYALAKEVPKGKAIVELGAWMGKSTIMLAAGSMAGSRVPVYAVDYFTVTHTVGHEYKPYLPGDTKDYLSIFMANIHSAGLSSIVHPIKCSSTKAAEKWEGPQPHLIFIDGDHGYHAVRSDFLAWLDHCSPGALVVFHDFNFSGHPGVGMFVDCLSVTSIISRSGIVDSIWYGELVGTAMARTKYCLGHVPYVAAWLLNISLRIIRKISRLASLDRNNLL